MSRDGVLNRLDLALCRDHTDKIYVQHRMRESGKELYSWLEEGRICTCAAMPHEWPKMSMLRYTT